MDAQIISIGTELTAGLTVDTNAAWIAGRLAAHGIRITRHVTVADNERAIAEAVRSAANQAAFVVVNGGLGPTADDLTRQAIAAAAGVPLVQDLSSLERIRAFFEQRGRKMADSNVLQSFLPEGGTTLENTCGTAPGFRVQIGQTSIFALPGVPYEMKEMYRLSVEPVVEAAAAGATTVTRTIRCFGATEASTGEKIGDLMRPGREPAVGITAHEAVISVRVIARGRDRASADAAADADEHIVRERLGNLVFGGEGDTLASAVGDLLRDKRLKLSTAESCTGGLLAKMLTDAPGSSDYFIGGFVTYSNEQKVRVLDLPKPLIAQHGAVSEEVAGALAEGCRRVTGSDFALATTGVAGPTGGTADKPVGLVYIALANADAIDVRRLMYGEHLDRASIRDRACKAVLNLLRLQFLQELRQST